MYAFSRPMVDFRLDNAGHEAEIRLEMGLNYCVKTAGCLECPRDCGVHREMIEEHAAVRDLLIRQQVELDTLRGANAELLGMLASGQMELGLMLVTD